ncbi:MAG TPA: serine/threonine-protein kinase [Pseudomonadales bacterium]
MSEPNPDSTRVRTAEPDATVINPTVIGARAAPADAIPLGPGSVIKERFVIESEIGHGGMGVIYRARDLRKEENGDRDPYVAIKVLSNQFRRDSRMVVALQREAHKAQTLAHPNITTVFDFDRDDAMVFITMEVLEGDPLDRVIESNPQGLEKARAMTIIRGLCLGLAYAHNKNIIHSDFKPGNVFLTDDNRTKILDFGIARAAPVDTFTETNDAAEPPPRVSTKSGRASEQTEFDAGELGALTPSYASCEMFESKQPHPSDDVFALAIVAYQLLSGRHPFDFQPAPHARAAKVVPAPIKGLKRREWRALMRGLAFEREERSANAAEFLKDLEGSPRLRLAAAVGLTLMLATMGYVVYDRVQATIAAAPDIAFVELPQETQSQFTSLLADGDRLSGFGDMASALELYKDAYELHPRNPDALERIESLFERVVAIGLKDAGRDDLATLKQNLEGVLAIDGFIAKRPSLLAADRQLAERLHEL